MSVRGSIPCPRRNPSLLATDARKLRALAKQFDLDLIVSFGSQARELTHPRSDVDIAVRTRVPEPHRDFEWHLRLRNAVEALVGREDVDTIVLNGRDSLLLFEIASDGRPLYERQPHTFLEFQSYAARRYWDDAKFRRMTTEYLLRDVNGQ